MCADESDPVSESEAHLCLEHLVDGPATQLRIGQTGAGDGTRHGVSAAVLVLDGHAAAGRDVDGEPAQQSPEVRATDRSAVRLEDGLEQLVHDGAGHGAEGDQTCVLGCVAQAAIGAQMVALCDVDLAGVMESEPQSLREDVGSSEVACHGRSSGRKHGRE